jgi:hypothetical protein
MDIENKIEKMKKENQDTICQLKKLKNEIKIEKMKLKKLLKNLENIKENLDEEENDT